MRMSALECVTIMKLRFRDRGMWRLDKRLAGISPCEGVGRWRAHYSLVGVGVDGSTRLP
jgi:hypothetical protein